MRYEIVHNLSDEEFKRSTGVRRSTFKKRLAVLAKGRRNVGRPPKLSRADQLLMTLMYWRAYRTAFPIGVTDGVREATVCRTINKVEQGLRHETCCHWPGQTSLHAPSTALTVVLVEATDQASERPQTTTPILQGPQKASHPASPRHGRPEHGPNSGHRLWSWPHT